MGAGLGGDDAQTRSQVEYDATAKTRTLKFTACDQLYIVGDIDATHRMCGYLALTSGGGTTSATFSGDLTVWVTSDGSKYTEDNTYTLQHPDNPMLEYGSNKVTATLIHKDAISGSITIKDDSKLCNFVYTPCLVTGQSDNASELMNPNPGKIETYYIYFYLHVFNSGYGSEAQILGHYYYLACLEF